MLQPSGQVILKAGDSSGPFHSRHSQGSTPLRFPYVNLAVGTALAQKVSAVVLVQQDVSPKNFERSCVVDSMALWKVWP